MYKKKTMLFLYAETPIHPGAGSGVGVIDLPVQREAFSGLPIFQASGIKGAMREHFETQIPRGWPASNSDDKKPANPIIDAFGPDTEEASDHAGALTLGDAKLLLFPIQSLYGVFAYVTCPLVLHRFKRDMEMIGATLNSWPTELPRVLDAEISIVAEVQGERSLIAVQDGGTPPSWRSVFREFTFTAKPNDGTRDIAEFLRDHCLPATPEHAAWKRDFSRRFAIVPDDVFRDFTKLGTEVISRNRIDDDTKTVQEGGLWIEEHLPSETVLYCPVLAADPLTNTRKREKALQDANDVLAFLKSNQVFNGQSFCGVHEKRLQIGGDHTLGRGIVMAHFYV